MALSFVAVLAFAALGLFFLGGLVLAVVLLLGKKTRPIGIALLVMLLLGPIALVSVVAFCVPSIRDVRAAERMTYEPVQDVPTSVRPLEVPVLTDTVAPAIPVPEVTTEVVSEEDRVPTIPGPDDTTNDIVEPAEMSDQIDEPAEATTDATVEGDTVEDDAVEVDAVEHADEIDTQVDMEEDVAED